MQIDLKSIDANEMQMELRRRGYAVVMVAPETLNELVLSPYDIEEPAWRVIDEIMENRANDLAEDEIVD